MSSSNYLSANSGGIKRGDSAETGDLAAQRNEADDNVGSGANQVPPESDEQFEGLTIKAADDPSLGLTDIGDVPPEDWAADTGPTRTGEEVEADRKR